MRHVAVPRISPGRQEERGDIKKEIHITLNGEERTLEVFPYRLLLDQLRDEIGMTGTKEGCGTGDCGACTVLLNGKPVNMIGHVYGYLTSRPEGCVQAAIGVILGEGKVQLAWGVGEGARACHEDVAVSQNHHRLG